MEASGARSKSFLFGKTEETICIYDSQRVTAHILDRRGTTEGIHRLWESGGLRTCRIFYKTHGCQMKTSRFGIRVIELGGGLTGAMRMFLSGCYIKKKKKKKKFRREIHSIGRGGGKGRCRGLKVLNLGLSRVFASSGAGKFDVLTGKASGGRG